MTDLLGVKNNINNRLSDYTKLIHKNCPFCGGEMLSVVCSRPQIDKCAECGQAFRQEMAENTIEQYKGKPPMPSWLESRAAARHHYNFINKAIGFNAIGSILEIGAGNGALLKLIRSKNEQLDITAVEPSSSHCGALSEIQDINVVENYMENVIFNRRFDLVIMSHVLEHIERPLEAIKYVYDNLLTRGGFLYIDIPNQDYELTNNEIAAKAPTSHLYFFNGANMPYLLAGAGFEKCYFQGVKYKTLPAYYGRILGWIETLENRSINKYLIYSLKAINKISLYASLIFRNLTGVYPKEIPINNTDHRYNNIAIAARK